MFIELESLYEIFAIAMATLTRTFVWKFHMVTALAITKWIMMQKSILNICTIFILWIPFQLNIIFIFFLLFFLSFLSNFVHKTFRFFLRIASERENNSNIFNCILFRGWGWKNAEEDHDSVVFDCIGSHRLRLHKPIYSWLINEWWWWRSWDSDRGIIADSNSNSNSDNYKSYKHTTYTQLSESRDWKTELKLIMMKKKKKKIPATNMFNIQHQQNRYFIITTQIL